VRNPYEPTCSDTEKEELSVEEHSLLIKRKTIGFIGAGVACSIFSFGAFFLTSPGKNGSNYTALGPAGSTGTDHSIHEQFTKPSDNKPALTDEPTRYDSDARRFEQSKPIPLPDENGGVTKPSPAPVEPSPLPVKPKEQVQYWLSSANVSPTKDKRYYRTMLDAMPSYRQVHMRGYRMDSEGDVQIKDTKFHREFPAKARSKNRNIQIFATIQSPSGYRMYSLIHTPSSRSTAIRKLVQFAQDNGLHGLNLEVMHLDSRNRDDFAEFIEGLSRELHRNGKKLAISFNPHLFQLDEQPARSTVSLLKRLGEAVDEIKVIQVRSDIQQPGPIAPLSWTDLVLNNLKKYVPADKVFADYQAMALDWANDNQIVLSVKDALAIMNKITGKPVRDSNGELYSTFTLAGLRQIIYCQDMESMQFKMQRIKQEHRKLGGVFIDFTLDGQSTDQTNKLLNLLRVK
jgi:hypothetical protein